MDVTSRSSHPPNSLRHSSFILTHYQVEYAVKAVEAGSTAVGIRCKDGVVLAVEKLVTSKLLKPNANKRIATIDRNMGVVRCISQAHHQRHHFITNTFHRSQQASSPTAATSSPARATKPLSGAPFTKPPSLSPRLQTAWARTCRRTRCTTRCDRSASRRF